MNSVNRTLYIPLYGKALVSRKGILLQDQKAEEIWNAAGIKLRGKSRSKWLAYYMAMRASVFDEWTKERLAGNMADGIVLHIGCGLDGRAERVGNSSVCWYDVDFADVIRERRKYYSEDAHYHMEEADVRTNEWMKQLPRAGKALVIMEGVSMYLSGKERKALLEGICGQFEQVRILMDCYSVFAANMSKYKNPINDVGVYTVYGMDDPAEMENDRGLRLIKEHPITPKEKIRELKKSEQAVFSMLYGGKLAQKLYRIYEYGTENENQREKI